MKTRRTYIGLSIIAILVGLVWYWPSPNRGIDNDGLGTRTADPLVSSAHVENPLVSPSETAASGVETENATTRPSFGSGAITGVFGRLLDDPYSVYVENITSAEGGNPLAQYEISNIFFECKRLPTQQYLDDVIESGVLPQDMGKETQKRLDMCRQLIDHLDEGEFDEWGSWLSKSAAQGYPLALGRDAVFSPGKYTLSQAQEIMKAVVRTPGPEKFTLVASYFVNYKDDDNLSYYAWMKLACESSPECNIDEFLGESAEPLRPNEKEQIERLVGELMSAIERQAWDDIAL